MISNSRKIHNSHKKFLNKSRDVVGKRYEKLFVLMLRGVENFCKLLDPEEGDDNLGLTKSELQNLSQNQFDDLYRLLLSYFAFALTGDAIPGSLRDRIGLTITIVGDKYIDPIMKDIPRELQGAELMKMTTKETTSQVIKLLKVSNPNEEQIYNALKHIGFEFVGMKAKNISDRKYCFIATDIYRDYNHPNVKVLRNFRDLVLVKSILGRIFIKAYYKLSPLFIRTRIYDSILRNYIKKLLDTFVKFLKNS